MEQTEIIGSERNRLLGERWEKYGSLIITALCLIFIVLAWAAGRNDAAVLEIVLSETPVQTAYLPSVRGIAFNSQGWVDLRQVWFPPL